MSPSKEAKIEEVLSPGKQRMQKHISNWRKELSNS